MPVASAPKLAEIARLVGEGVDPKKALIDAVGDIGGATPTTDLVLVATYIGSDKKGTGKTALYLPNDYVKEDEYQGKVGLVLKRGPYAYGDWEDEAIRGENAQPGSWVVYHIKDAWPVQIHGVACRLVPYDKIRMVVDRPAMVF
jgi:hypothetical protein